MLRRRPRESPTATAVTGDAHEAALLARIAGGDRSAFELLYRCYFPRLSRFLNRMTRSAELIEEIVNDTMLVVWRKAQSFDGSCKVSTWIIAIAYRKALKALKASDGPIEFDPDAQPGDSANEPEHAMSEHQLQQAVALALDTLPLEQRMVVYLTYFYGLGYGEIADIMECPANTVKTRMFYARRRLKTALSGQME